jgi:addiction module HigA family antidote
MTMRKFKPVTPGELLLEEFLTPMEISQYRLAKEIGVPAQRIGDIVAGKRAITADTDLRLCRFLGLSNGYWLRAQAACDMEVAERELGATLAKITPWAKVEKARSRTLARR